MGLDKFIALFQRIGVTGIIAILLGTSAVASAAMICADIVLRIYEAAVRKMPCDCERILFPAVLARGEIDIDHIHADRERNDHAGFRI